YQTLASLSPSVQRFWGGYSLQNNSVTIGEFIAHLISINNLQDIITNMSKLLGKDFMEIFKATRAQLPMQQTLFEEIDTLAELLSTIAAIFKNRHSFCHEIAMPSEEEDFRPKDYCQKTTEFLWITENVISGLLKTSPSRPK
ncbi:hypothetical protein EYB53_024400, partial [Candidatus Chloroploca sp. M-50]